MNCRRDIHRKKTLEGEKWEVGLQEESVGEEREEILPGVDVGLMPCADPTT